MAVKDYKNFTFSSGCVAGDDYLKFQRICKNELKRKCAALGINLHSFNKNHYEWSAVLERNGKFAYVSISDVRYWSNWYGSVLVRSMAHDKDWTGGSNNFASWDKVPETADKILEQGY